MRTVTPGRALDWLAILCRSGGPVHVAHQTPIDGKLALLLPGPMAIVAAQDKPKPAKPATVTLVIDGMT
jgi:hypothetical protein